MIAALYVARGGVYWDLPSVDAWDQQRDARLYAGPYPCVAHPPCERFGRYWSGGPNPKAKRRKLGDDNGCFKAAFAAVQKWGGILEHPEASHAWELFDINKPPRHGGWITADFHGGWTCCVEQGHYGHRARKATWLYYSGDAPPPLLHWGPSSGLRLDEGVHSTEERARLRAAGIRPAPRLHGAECAATPIPFRDLLISIAESCNARKEANAAR